MGNNTSPSDCPFCRTNQLLKGTILAETANAYLIENSFFPGNYLIIPEAHTESLHGLPDVWWQDVKVLLGHIPNLTDYNVSFNIGRSAGQTIKHLHMWVIPRGADEPAAKKGLITLIKFRNEHDS